TATDLDGPRARARLRPEVAGGERVERVVAHAHLDARRGAADRLRADRLVGRGVDGDEAVLGLAVVRAELDAEALGERGEGSRRQPARADVADGRYRGGRPGQRHA